MPLYRILTPLRYGAKVPLQPGEQIEMVDAVAEGLLACGAIELDETEREALLVPTDPATVAATSAKPRAAKPRAPKKARA